MPSNLPVLLVVDDETANHTMFTLLGRGLFEVRIASDLTRANTILDTHRVDAAVIDHRLGEGATGLALFESLACPKILLSAEADMATWTSERHGLWLRKPLDFLIAQKQLRALAARFLDNGPKLSV